MHTAHSSTGAQIWLGTPQNVGPLYKLECLSKLHESLIILIS